MAVDEPLLEPELADGEKDCGYGLVFEIQDRDPMLLCGIPHTIRGH